MKILKEDNSNSSVSKSILDQKFFDYFLIVSSIILGLYLNWDILSIGLFSFIIWQILRPFSRKNLNIATFSLLFLVPVLLLFKKNQGAGEAAFVAFCLLLISLSAAASETFSRNNSSD